jgi:tripartite-type tricarboxylate transporter receptor subunit TctC
MSRRDFLRLGGVGLAGAAFGTTLLGSCGGGGGASAENFPDGPIQLIVAYAAGGGTDVGARILQPYVEEELGVSLEILNRPGGGGWVGWTELANADPDGYTIGFINSPNLMTGYLNPEFNRDRSLKDFSPIANQVTDYGAIAINPNDDRFQDLKGLIEYAQNNDATATSTGVGSDDHFASLTLNDEYQTRFEAVHNEGSAESRAAVLGGNVDALFANVGEIVPLHEDGELKAVGVMRDSEERSEFLPDVPTLREAGYPDVYSWSSRGLAGPAGINDEIMNVLVSAFEAGITNEEHIQELADQGLQVDYVAQGEYLNNILQQDEQLARRLGKKYLW